MTIYEQLTAVEVVFNDLLAEQDEQALRARLREGPFPERQDGKPYASDFPFEEFTIGVAHNVAILAEQFYSHVRKQFPLPPGGRVVTSTHTISSWRDPAEPADSAHPPSPPISTT